MRPILIPKPYFRLRRLRLRTGLPELILLKRFAFAATRRRYRRTISSPEAPAIRLAPALKAASIFSLTISSASRWALLPPSISFIIRSTTTRFASTANIIKESNIGRSSPNYRIRARDCLLTAPFKPRFACAGEVHRCCTPQNPHHRRSVPARAERPREGSAFLKTPARADHSTASEAARRADLSWKPRQNSGSAKKDRYALPVHTENTEDRAATAIVAPANVHTTWPVSRENNGGR
jgi:hypothetical protein